MIPSPSHPLICIAGKSLLAVEVLRHVVETYGRTSVIACPYRSDQGEDGSFLSLVKAAQDAGIVTVLLEELYSIPNLIFISLEFDRIVRPSCFASRRLFNLHYSLLPAYKGCYPGIWPILNGESKSGVTLHEIDSGIDTGPIIAQADFPLKDMRAIDLYLRCQKEGIALVKQYLPALVNGRYETRPQAAEGATYYSRDSIDFRNWPIQLRATAAQIAGQFHARYFPHFQRPEFGGKPIARCTITGERSTGQPGDIQYESPEVIRIATIDYDLLLHLDLQPEKGQPHGGNTAPL